MGLEKPLTQRTFIQSVITPSGEKSAGDVTINKAFVILTMEANAQALSAGDIVFLMFINQRIRVGYYNGSDGVNTANVDTINFTGGVFTVSEDTALQFRTDFIYKALAF